MQPVLLCGGNGSRLWPLVDDDLPKHLLLGISGDPLIVETMRRFEGPRFTAPILVCNARHLKQTHDVVIQSSCEFRSIIAEPASQDTCVAIALAAKIIGDSNPDSVLLISPSDQAISDTEPLLEAIHISLPRAKDGKIVTFGIPPTHDNPALGYLVVGQDLTNIAEPGPIKVDGFREKPTPYEMDNFQKNGRCLWNSGILLAKASTLLHEIGKFCPAITEYAAGLAATATRNKGLVSFDARRCEPLKPFPTKSIDLEVLSFSDILMTVPVEINWADLGTWPNIAEHARHNLVSQWPHLLEFRNSNVIVHNDDKEIRIEGLENTLVAAKGGRILVRSIANPEHETRKGYKNRLPRGKHNASSSTVENPWGHLAVLDDGNGYVTRRLFINQGCSTPWQTQRFESEHFVVVSGTAHMTVRDDTVCLEVGQSLLVQTGATHQIRNEQEIPLVVIATRIGTQCPDTDNIRLKADYGKPKGIPAN